MFWLLLLLYYCCYCFDLFQQQQQYQQYHQVIWPVECLVPVDQVVRSISTPFRLTSGHRKVCVLVRRSLVLFLRNVFVFDLVFRISQAWLLILSAWLSTSTTRSCVYNSHLKFSCLFDQKKRSSLHIIAIESESYWFLH